MKNLSRILMIILLLQALAPLGMGHGAYSNVSFADEQDLYLHAGDRYYRVKSDLSGFGKISAEVYEQHQATSEEGEPVKGIPAIKVAYEQKDRDIYARGVKIFTLPADPVNSEIYVHNKVSALYEIMTKDNRLFYYILSNDGVPHPTTQGDTDDLVEVKDGKVIHHIKVYSGLEYVDGDIWRSTYCFSGAGYYALTQHSISSKFKDLNLWENVSAYAVKKGFTSKVENEDLASIGNMERNAFFGLQCRDKKGKLLPLIRVFEVNVKGDVWERGESIKSLNNTLFISNYTIYSLDQDGQVLRRLKDLRSLYLEGSATNLGSFTKTSKPLFKGRLPIYLYHGEEYLCLEDLTLLGYTMKWDAKTRCGHWTYTGKKTGKPHSFKKHVIYDNDVFTSLDGVYFHIYNAEGYSLIKVQDVSGYLKD